MPILDVLAHFYQAFMLEKHANSYLFETWIVLVPTLFYPPLTLSVTVCTLFISVSSWFI